MTPDSERPTWMPACGKLFVSQAWGVTRQNANFGSQLYGRATSDGFTIHSTHDPSPWLLYRIRVDPTCARSPIETVYPEGSLTPEDPDPP